MAFIIWMRRSEEWMKEHLFWVLLVFNQTRRKTRVWYFYSQVSQWRSCECFFLFCFIFSFGEKKIGLAWSNIVLRRILTVFIKNYKAINSFPKYSLCRMRTLWLYVCFQYSARANYGRRLRRALCILGK